MITTFHFVRLAVRNLRRTGTRIIFALLCIAFGIMALVSMTMLAQSIASAVIITPAELIGGDLSIVRKNGDTLRPQDIEYLETLQQSGAISRYTLIALSGSITFHSQGSEELHFVGNGMGVEPQTYPLTGALKIGEPANTRLSDLIQKVGDVVVTRDVAEVNGLKVGDPIILADLRTGFPVEGTVRGIAYDTPNHQGDKIYYSIDSAQKLANDLPAINTVIANSNQPAKVNTELEASGWAVDWTAARMGGKTANFWVIGLRGGGILGLLVGGIGVANTMQVLLRRRQKEIAIWKTLGYRAGELRLIFVIEAGILGLMGSLVGCGLGILTSSGLLAIFRRTSSLLYAWTFSPAPPLMGILSGTLTTMIFAAWAIVLSSQVKPMALLRNEPTGVQPVLGCQSVVLGLFLAALFAVLTGVVMESAPGGIGVLILIGIGVVSSGAFFSGLLWLCSHMLPLRGFPVARMALNSLRRRGIALIFAMIALFVGVISLGAGLVVTQLSERRISGGAVDFQGYNLNILAPANQENAIRRLMEAQHPEKVSVGYRAPVKRLSVFGRGEPVSGMDAVLVGRSDPEDYVVSGAAWGSQMDGVYAYRDANLEAGSQVQATLMDGTIKTFLVVGSYEINYHSNNLYPPAGLLMTADAFTRAARPDTVTYFVQVPSDQLESAAAALGSALPHAMVVNLVAYAARFMQSYRSAYILPMVMAALSMLAGFLLVANSLTLAMLDRRYEVGILKAVGYSRRQVLSIFAIEYGLVGLLATAAGITVMEGFLIVLAAATHHAGIIMLLTPPSLALIIFCGVGLTLLTVLGVTWKPTGVPPLAVLNDRN